MVKVLIIDDDISMNTALANIAEDIGMSPICATTIGDGLKMAGQQGVDLILMDVNLPDGDGIDAMPAIHELPSAPEVIVLTGYADMTRAEAALESGAWDYIQKPSSSDELMLVMGRAMEYRKQKKNRRLSAFFDRSGIIGTSRIIRKTFDQASQAAACDANVLITGESGTGKELFARAIHANSPRADNPLVVVDCAAITESLAESVLFGHDKGSFTGADKNRQGLVRQADGGTLFLDEVGELSPSVQKKLLRLLQEHEFRPVGSDIIIKSDFKLIAATNRDLGKMADQGDFRRDLLFRLQGIDIDLPPLRDRREDIKALVLDYANAFCDKRKIKNKVVCSCFMEALVLYDWPGNIRELFTVMEKVMASAWHDATVYSFHLPPFVRISRTRQSLTSQPGDLQTFKLHQAASAKNYLEKLLLASGGNKDRACRISGLSKSYLYKLLKEHAVG
ncbi:MAG: sigma-54-dependent Fis family transcriptional regulator [Desulfobacteraceae bacterium]|nr:sigma-54-dependent Fis family transcriptional regulator [Desulfobacteraceae bacterium]